MKQVHGTTTIERLDTCPKCGSGDLKRYGNSCTLLGFGGGEENDPNHWKSGFDCRSCSESFYEHWVPRHKSYWVADKDNHVLFGEPTCCENGFTMSCQCGGKITHITALRAKERGDDLNYLSFKIGPEGATPNQSMYWQCDRCGEKLPDRKFGMFDIG